MANRPVGGVFVKSGVNYEFLRIKFEFLVLLVGRAIIKHVEASNSFGN